MRLSLMGAIVILGTGCSVTSASSNVVTPLRGAVSVQTTLSVPPSSTAPVQTKIPEKPEIGSEQRKAARSAFQVALEHWSAGRMSEAQAQVDLGLLAIARKLPDDRATEQWSDLTAQSSMSLDERVIAGRDLETLYVADAVSGSVLGLRLHDFGNTTAAPGVSPKGTYVVAPSGGKLVVYETQGLVQRAVVEVRDGAPFAFLDDEHLVTVRLGALQVVSGPVSSEPRSYVVRELSKLEAPTSSKTASSSGLNVTESAASSMPSEPSYRWEAADDELTVIELKTGKVDNVLKLTIPPDQGLLRRVASLPRSEECSRNSDCERFAFNPAAIGRRVEDIRVHAGVIGVAWRGGSVSLHRIRDQVLIGSFRARGEHWKPGLFAIMDNPPRAAVVTSTPELGRGSEPSFSVTALVDLKSGKVVELIDECRWATGLSFSLDGKTLMVGDLRKACLHDARTGRLREVTEEVRLATGPSDELQDVSVRPVQAQRWLLRTLDGTYGIFDEKNGKALLRGRQPPDKNGYVATGARAIYLTDYSAQRAELVTLGPSKIERRVLRLEELEQKQLPPEARNTPEGHRASALEVLTLRTCLVEGFRLPGEFCRLAAGNQASK